MYRGTCQEVLLNNSLSERPTFIEHEDPEILVQRFVEELERRRALIVEEVRRMNPILPEDVIKLPSEDLLN